MALEYALDDTRHNIRYKIDRRNVKDAEGTTQNQVYVECEERDARGEAAYDWILDEGLGGEEEVGCRIVRKRKTDVMKWKVPLSTRGKHVGKTHLRVTSVVHNLETGNLKTLNGNLLRRAATDGTKQDRERLPFRVEWDEESEDDEETDMCFHKSGDDLYPITVVGEDEEDGMGTLDEGLEAGPEAEHRGKILEKDSLLIETEETRPDYDIEPTGGWTIAERNTGQEGEWVG
eukprot:6669412-Pyramimonas_sp.AAC.1